MSPVWGLFRYLQYSIYVIDLGYAKDRSKMLGMEPSHFLANVWDYARNTGTGTILPIFINIISTVLTVPVPGGTCRYLMYSM